MKGIEASVELLVRSEIFCKKKKEVMWMGRKGEVPLLQATQGRLAKLAAWSCHSNDWLFDAQAF